MAWDELITEDEFEGLAAPTAAIGGAAVAGVSTTGMQSDAAPEIGPRTRRRGHGSTLKRSRPRTASRPSRWEGRRLPAT